MGARICPCGTGVAYDACCGRFHSGRETAATPEQVMRSRYAAFAVGDAAYLLRTWHPDTRPATLDLTDGPRWTGLDVQATSGGSAFHTEGTVEFTAHYRDGRETGSMHELSRFVRVDGVWLYHSPVGPG